MIKRLIRASALGFAFLTLFACRGQSGQVGYKNIDTGRALGMVNSSAPPVILDVRTPAEFTGELGHIPGARLVPIQTLSDSLEALAGLKNRDILVVCRTGNRSAVASRRLVEAGFNRVYNLSGGMVSWNREAGNTR